MDGNNDHPSSGHLLTQAGHAFAEFLRGVVSSHSQQSQDTAAPAASSDSHDTQVDGAPQPSLGAPVRREMAVETDSTVDAPSPAASSSRFVPDEAIASTSPSDTASVAPVHNDEDCDVEMSTISVDVQANGATSSSQPPPYTPLPPPRTSRRARVDDDDEEEGDYWRDSNRQRMNSPTPHDEERHHFMPIPDNHGAPQPTPDTNAVPQSNSDARPAAPTRSSDARADHNAPGEGAPHDTQHPQNQEPRGQQPSLNFVFNIPLHGLGLEPQPGEGNAHGGGEAPGNHGFVFPPLTFPFGPITMDFMEERDDPERAKRLVDGLEEVSVGLIKRMERVGGPGSNCGEVPTCAVCWESLLSPQGGGFEGNAELAKAEAAEAAREDEASQQQRQSSALGSTPPAPHSETSSSSDTFSTTSASTSSDEENHPKIVVLPCSHVFHASCLLPWFSKPGRTTCPSCRFDIDPDSLTYTPRRLRAHHPAPQAASQTAAGQRPPFFGPIPLSALSRMPPAAAQAAHNPPNIPSIAVPDAQPAQPAQENVPEGQHGESRLPLPPFITFDVSMIIPVFPGRPAGAAQPAAGAPTDNAAPRDDPQGGAPQPPRTDNNGFRLEDSVLADAVRRTLERVLRRPAPGPQAQQPQPPVEGAAPAENAPREPPLDWYSFAGPLPGFPPVPPPTTVHTEAAAPPPRSAPKRKWTLPPAPGPTLRQLVERNEREMGLRCSDVSCGVGPSDDDPVSTFDATALRQISIRPLKDDRTGREAVCEHKFHPSCLVSAERVAGWGGEDKKEERENEGENVEVSCPVCRAVGAISRVDWDEGACALA
ncbi:hypothetical protein C8Q79DRAFT_952479 [Trametes meyenii]|nr:hypothetical protein C8Q79DRAFT_952479 [Trametes meyenii]